MQLIKKIIIVLTVIAISIFNNNLKVEARATVSFQVFYDNLSPYGSWVADPDFGYVWIPTVDLSFHPYSTSGHWILTEYGWTWVSDYPWGWAPFHYGRWRYNSFYGWQWIPGTQWGPAWVCWRRSRGYYGWTPLAPGVSVNVAIGSRYTAPHHHWVFVQEKYISHPHVSHYYAPHKNNETIIKNSTVINNTYVDNRHHNTYISGPKKDEVQKVTGKSLKPVALKESTKPGQSLKGNELSIYRPSVMSDNKSGKPAPKKVTDLEDVKTINGKEPAEAQNAKTSQTKTDEMQNNSDKKQQSDIDNKSQKKESDLKKVPEQNKEKQNKTGKKQQNPKPDTKKSEPPKPK